MFTARLENWDIKILRSGGRLTGNVYGHPLHRDGTCIFAPVVRSCFLDGRTVKTTNTTYTLGQSAKQAVR